MASITNFDEVEKGMNVLSREVVHLRDDVRLELGEMGKRLTLLDDPNSGVIQRIAGNATADRCRNYRTARNLLYGLCGVGAVILALAVAGWFLRQGTEGRIADVRGDVATVVTSVAGVRGDLGAVTSRVEKVERRMDRTEDHLASLERRVVGVRRLVGETVGRTGSLEDTQGVDHNKRLFRLPGFAPCKLDGETLVPATLTPAMKKELVKIVALTNTGWTVKEVLGFADETPFRRGGKILPNSDSLNGACATARATIVASHLGLSDITPAAGRGITTKFGGLDVNRSVLIYIERSAS